MADVFLIRPNQYEAFNDEAEQIEKCKEWGLLSDKAAKSKTFYYKGHGKNFACSIIGYVDKITAVIELEDKRLHCIHPSYLKEMQASNYGQKLSAAAEDTAADESVEPEAVEAQVVEAEVVETETVQEEHTPAEEGSVAVRKAEQSAKNSAKKDKVPKFQLPEDKVKMTATVTEFTTVPNNFSDNEDEVVIYDAVAILELETEIGTAWSSNSATLKKLELAVGDTITFEAKIVKKKLTKHPVPYKINNPSKIQKT